MKKITISMTVFNVINFEELKKNENLWFNNQDISPFDSEFKLRYDENSLHLALQGVQYYK